MPSEDDEDEAWSKVTPVVGSTLESPEKSASRNIRNQGSFLRSGNHSEGEMSDPDDVEVLSSGKRSNYTNTSVIVGGNNDDTSS